MAQSPEQQILELKAKLFDRDEIITDIQNQLNAQNQVLQSISQLLNLSPDENGMVTYEQLVNAVDSLMATPQVETE